MGFKNYRKELVGVTCFIILFNCVTSMILENAINIEKVKNNQLEKKTFRDSENVFKLNNAVFSCNDILLYEELLYFVGGRARIVDGSKISKPKFYYYNNSEDIYLRTIARVRDTLLIGFTDYDSELLAQINPHENITKCIIVPGFNFSINKMVGTNDRLYILNETSISMQYYTVFTIYNAMDLDNLSLIKKHYFPPNLKDFYLFNNYVYFIKNQDRLVIYQLNSSSELSFIKEYMFNNINSLYFTNNSLFICNEQGIILYNHSNPLALTKQCEYNITDAQSVCVSDNFAFAINDRQIFKFDISNVNDIKLLKQKTISKQIDSGLKKILEKDGKLFIMTEYTISNPYTYGDFLLIYDSSNIRRVYPFVLPLTIPMRIFVYLVLPFTAFTVCTYTFFVCINKLQKRKEKTSKLKLEKDD